AAEGVERRTVPEPGGPFSHHQDAAPTGRPHYECTLQDLGGDEDAAGPRDQVAESTHLRIRLEVLDRELRLLDQLPEPEGLVRPGGPASDSDQRDAQREGDEPRARCSCPCRDACGDHRGPSLCAMSQTSRVGTGRRRSPPAVLAGPAPWRPRAHGGATAVPRQRQADFWPQNSHVTCVAGQRTRSRSGDRRTTGEGKSYTLGVRPGRREAGPLARGATS